MSWTSEVYKNTASKPMDIVSENARIINVISSSDQSLKDPNEIAFVVSRTREFEDYKKVFRQYKRSTNPDLTLTSYSESLLESCFRGWN
ncbi:hypothetical protein [Psychrobacillus sp. FSL K6-1267]|uniref:hypothetical protein n=1 Tax=Psychrobacillus sp. FSL K6-1267 TaxID=2921543 RepID=UPI0030F5923F